MSALSFRRFAAAWALITSGLLVVFAYFTDPAIETEGVELARAYAENPGRIQLSAHALRLAFAFQIVPVFVLVSMIRTRAAWLANTAGILAVLGMTTLPGLLVVDFYDLAIYDAVGAEGWTAVNDRLEQLPGMLAFFFTAFFPFVLALPLILLAAWRAGLLSWWPAALAVAGALSIEVIPGAVGLLVEAAVLIILGVVLYRMFKSVPAEAPSGVPEP